MPGRVLLSTIALGGLANAMVPADPTITAAAVLPRQNNDRFIGWVEFSGSWYSETCNPGLTWYQDGKYGQCCPATLASCYAPTACVSGSLIYPYSDKSTTRTIACTENYGDASLSICNTAFIFENFGDSAPKTDIVCGPSSVNWSYYRKVPASVTEISSKAPTSIAQPVSTALVAPVGSGNGGGESKAWIAGAVVGPIVGLGLIGAAIWFFLRKRRNSKTAPQQGGAAMATVDPSQPPAGVGGYTDAKPQFVPQQQQQQYDPYANQNAYNAQQAYGGEGPTSPVPQYNPNTPAGADYYGGDVKQAHAAPPANGAFEMGGETSAAAPAAGQSTGAPAPQAAELGGDTSHAAPTQGHFSELPGNTANPKP